MNWLRRRSHASLSQRQIHPLVDPDPLRTPEDAFETGFLIGFLKNTWQAVAVKNLKDRRFATGDTETPAKTIGPAGHVAGHRAGDD